MRRNVGQRPSTPRRGVCFVTCSGLEPSELSRRNGADAIGAADRGGAVERADAHRFEWREPAPDEELDLALIGVSGITPPPPVGSVRLRDATIATRRAPTAFRVVVPLAIVRDP